VVGISNLEHDTFVGSLINGVHGVATLALGRSHLSWHSARIHGLVVHAGIAGQVPDGLLVAVAHLVGVEIVSLVWFVEPEAFDIEIFVDCADRACSGAIARVLKSAARDLCCRLGGEMASGIVAIESVAASVAVSLHGLLGLDEQASASRANFEVDESEGEPDCNAEQYSCAFGFFEDLQVHLFLFFWLLLSCGDFFFPKHLGKRKFWYLFVVGSWV